MSKALLILAAHADDAEFACGGTIHKLIRDGYDAHYLGMAIPAGVDRDQFEEESANATATLGIRWDQVNNAGLPVRNLASHRQQVLDMLIKVKHQLHPDVILAPSEHDVHQDHHVLHQEAVRAFKDRTLLGYEMPWNSIGIDNRLFVALEPEDLAQKIMAVKCYTSQRGLRYTTSKYIESLAEVRGQQVGVTAAESFEPVRIIW